MSSTTQNAYATFVSAVADYALFIADRAGTITTWSPGAEALFGLTASEAVGSAVRALPLTPSAEHALAIAADRGVHDDPVTLARADGSTVAYRLRITTLGDGARFVVAIREASAAGAHAGGPSESLERFFEMSLDHLVVASFDGFFRRVNAVWTQTLGWSREELLATPSVLFVHPDDREATLAARAKLIEGVWLAGFTNRYACKDGTYRWLEWKSVSYVEQRLVYGIARDVTKERAEREDKQRMLEQLIISERMASIGRLAAGVAHEVNNPLTYVMANLQAALDTLRSHAEGAPREVQALLPLLDDALAGAERVRKIVRGMKSFTGAEHERRGVVAIEPVLEAAIKIVRTDLEHRARLVRSLRPVPHVHADETRLWQVFVNLLLNAAQAIPEGDAGAHAITVSTWTEEGRAVIEVRDTGTGIDAATLPRIFDPFFTTKAVGEGTGLGLFICRNIVSAMGGELGVSSEPRRGSAFRVTLPPADAPPDRAAAPAPTPPRRTASVLIIDDEPVIGSVMRRMLTGYEVTVMTDAREALASIEAGVRFDTIFCDLMMPAMTGMQLYEELSRRFPAVAARVVFITGGAFTEPARRFLEQAPTRWLEKPFTGDQLRAAIEGLRAAT